MGKNEILVADDDVIAQNMLKVTLTDAGYSVIIAANGLEAIRSAVELLPTVIILDIKMPDIHGGEVADILRKNPKTKDIPIIFLSSVISEYEEKSSRKEIVSFLAKPYNREKLLNEVRKHFCWGNL